MTLKIKYCFSSLIAVLFVSFVHGQVSQGGYYDKGSGLLKAGRLAEADSLFLLYVNQDPSPGKCMQVANLLREANDIHRYHLYMEKASSLGNEDAMNIIKMECVKTDTVYYPNDVINNYRRYMVIDFDSCTRKTLLYFFQEKRPKEIDYAFYFVNPQELPASVADTFPDIRKYVGSIIFSCPQKQPEFPGGEERRIQYLQKMVKYPEEAKENGLSGKVFVTFIVNTDGSLSHIKVLRSAHKCLDEETLRVVRLMPPWTPGEAGGMKVPVRFNMPLKFNIQ